MGMWCLTSWIVSEYVGSIWKNTWLNSLSEPVQQTETLLVSSQMAVHTNALEMNMLLYLWSAQNTVNLALLGPVQNWGLDLGIKYDAQGNLHKSCWITGKLVWGLFPACKGRDRIGIIVCTLRMRDNGLFLSRRRIIWISIQDPVYWKYPHHETMRHGLFVCKRKEAREKLGRRENGG